MSQEKIRVGVVGVGIGTSLHIPGFQACPDTEVVAVCSARQERAEAAANKFGIPHVFTDYRKMLELDRLDAVSVTPPPPYTIQSPWQPLKPINTSFARSPWQ